MSKDPADIHIGNEIKIRRNLANLTLKELGDSIGVTFKQLQKYESGTDRISASLLFRISKVLGVSLGDFFDGLPIIDDATPPFEQRRLRYLETAQGRRFMRNVDCLPAEIRRRLAVMVATMVGQRER